MAETKPAVQGPNGSAQRSQARHPPDFSPAGERPAADAQPGLKRWLRVPTTVLVTLLVAALSVWVAPAFTRQWDDRQKARELQVELVELVWSTTAHIEAELRSFGYSSREDPWPVRQAILDGWADSRQEVETKLRVYYGEQGVEAWRSYVDALEALSFLAAYEAGTPDGRSWRTVVIEPLCYGACSRPEPNEFVRRIASGGEAGVAAADAIAIFRGRTELLRKSVLGTLSRLLTDQASTVADLILGKRPRGYSTTRRDLLRDLLP